MIALVSGTGMLLYKFVMSREAREKGQPKKTTPLTIWTSPCLENPLALKHPYTENPHSWTPSSPTPPTTLHNTNMKQSGFSLID